ncbi:MAG: DUF2828 family protein [Spirochaetaceae bacterium]|jgi:hypothetical protein|nr:DUF2828 family protein [Spirochaetaceae bacterium]
MTFIEKLETQIEERGNVSVTENAGLGYKTTGKKLVDMTFKISSYRGADKKTILADFDAAFAKTPELAVRWLFYVRDARQGLGERSLFRVIMENRFAKDEKFALLFPLVPEYGRWDDLVAIALRNTAVFDIIKNQFTKDRDDAKNGSPITLLAKWLPSVNSSSAKTQTLGKIFAKKLGLSCKDYRKCLSALRAHLNVIEVKMSANKWDAISYEAVPSKANVLYRNAFLKHDETRRKDFLERLKSGKTKINSAVNFPHDIVHQYYMAVRFNTKETDEKVDAALEELWKALPEYSIENTIVVADGSGSMYGNNLNGTGIMSIEIANALAVYYAERGKGEFKNKYITFSETPKLVDLSHCETLLAKLYEAAKHNEVANTNIEAVFDLLLDTACANNMKQEELPANVLVISDMEFDYCVSSNSEHSINEKIFTVIKNRWNEKGYKLPRLVFWNVCSRTGTIPVKENELGAALVSGFSPNVTRMIMSGKLDPFEALCDVLNSERYSKIIYG